MSFTQLGLADTHSHTLSELGHTQPTNIQRQAIPAILAGEDIIAAAPTGTGKTAAFSLPILQQLTGAKARPKYIRALIICPTRELACQLEDNIKAYGKGLGLRTAAAYGGVDTEPQKQTLIEGVDILIATPGRLLDLSNQRAVRFDELQTLVLDEADRMLNMGFIDEIKRLLERLPEARQNLLFTATMGNSIRQLAKDFMWQPREISASPKHKAAATIEQWLVTVDKDQKSALLSQLIKEQQWQQALIFIRTKHGAAKLVSQLAKRGIEADSIHGDRSQAMRSKVLAAFKAGEFKYLVATDVAARGLDIEQLPQVVNYDLPFITDEYIHRIGRTGRAGSVGEAISLVSKDDFKHLCAIESRLGHIIERREVAGFAPKKVVPVSILNYVPKNQRGDKAASPKPESKRPGRPKGKRPANKDNKKPAKNPSNKQTGPWPQKPTKPAAKPFNPWSKD
ncbi:MAG: DEAD/DEAH box helicase [Cellvibrionaceae bacterium]|nr:DEAD/DEAH box helicase [Cellvibrionaceae bacterium]